MNRHANLIAKATRLTLEDRVTPVPGRVFEVIGDHGTYLTAITADAAICSCPATSECSHLLAARHAAREAGRADQAWADLAELAETAELMVADLGDPADDCETRELGDPWGARRESDGQTEDVNRPRAVCSGRGLDRWEIAHRCPPPYRHRPTRPSTTPTAS